MMNADAIRKLATDRELWKLAVASIIGGLVVAWLAPAVRRIPPR